ncbi:MAG: hypothetical protein BRC44_16590 [Cyanobacteria bacterium QS_4_48_99]|nr:MAG: hypothetical protein BRC44_16590 [Cyanobacteria bacterium QS_4_48_99]
MTAFLDFLDKIILLLLLYYFLRENPNSFKKVIYFQQYLIVSFYTETAKHTLSGAFTFSALQARRDHPEA